MNTTNTKEDLRQSLIKICAEVAAFIRTEIYQVNAADIEQKEMNSLVSYVDKEAENSLVNFLKELTPDAGFITEEDTIDTKGKAQTWIIDPLDGTTNFLHKIPHFSISIALLEGEEVTLGIVYEIMLDNAYTAIKGQGAWENKTPIKVSSTIEPLESIVITGFPYRRDINIEASLAVLKHCVINCRGVRRLGSAALDLAYVASGKIDIYYENALNIWDLAAGALLVEEAGGKVTDYSGTRNFLKHGAIISSNGTLHDFILSPIQEHHT